MGTASADRDGKRLAAVRASAASPRPRAPFAPLARSPRSSVPPRAPPALLRYSSCRTLDRQRAGATPRRPLSFSSSSSGPSRAPERLAITTTSRPGGRSQRRRRNHSRTSRLNRFRCTAFPTFRLAVIPSRLGSRRGARAAFSSGPSDSGRPSLRRHVSTTRSWLARRRPWRSTRRKSRESRKRSACWKRPVRTLGLALLRRDRRSQPPPALGAPALQHSATRLRLHPFSKPMTPQSFDPTRLVSPLHACGSPLLSCRLSRQRSELSDRLVFVSLSIIPGGRAPRIQSLTGNRDRCRIGILAPHDARWPKRPGCAFGVRSLEAGHGAGPPLRVSADGSTARAGAYRPSQGPVNARLS